MKKLLICFQLLTIINFSIAQSVGIGTQSPNSSAMLDVTSTQKGLLIPRMTELQKGQINLPATGLLIWQTDGTSGFYYNGGSPEGPKWYMLSTANDSNWKLFGNNNIDPGQHFIGTTTQQPLNFRINNIWAGQLDSGKATLFGFRAGWQNEASSNTGFGHEVLYTNSTGFHNTGLGIKALYTNRSGNYNVAIGAFAAELNTVGNMITAIGTNALNHNSTGNANTAVGAFALDNNTVGDSNVAVGSGALRYGTSNSRNTAVGVNALVGPQTNDNTAVGYYALNMNQFGIANTAFGSEALRKNLNGLGNTGMGYKALSSSNYNWNAALGYWALRSNVDGAGNTAIGSNAMDGNIDANKSTALGYYAEIGGADRTNATAIGYRSYSECNNCLILGSVQGKNNAEASVRVGIGTTNPTGLLTLNSSLGGSPDIDFAADNITYGSLAFSNGAFKDLVLSTSLSNESGRIRMSAGNTQFKISPAGTVTIGPSGMVGPYTFLISDSDKDPMIQFQKGATNKGFIQIVNDDIKIGTNSENDLGHFFIRTNGADRMIVTNTGNVGIGTASPAYRLQVGNLGDGSQARANAWNTFSDARYKTNILEIPNALEKIESLHGYYYNWNTGKDESRQAGLLAQEVESVLPEIVSTDNEGYKSVDYGKMNALLIQAIKEQQKEIDEMKALLKSHKRK